MRRRNQQRGTRRSGNYSGPRRDRHKRNPVQASESGNKRERIAIESGHLVLIDQFMLANPQFVDHLAELIDAEPDTKNSLVEKFGGIVVELDPGIYRIERDPFKYSIIIHGERDDTDQEDIKGESTEDVGHIFVDTRCLAMIDRELLDDSVLLQKYQQLWFNGQDKACRDLLRDNGGAVRYGFNRNGDDLGVYRVPGKPIICLWPDVVETNEGDPVSAEI